MRVFLFTVVLAGICGASLRLYFSPVRLRSWIEQAVERSPRPLKLEFEGATLRLSDGSMPRLAIELNQVRLITAPECQTEPSLKASRLYIPFRVAALFKRKIAFGSVSGDDVEIDLDGLKARCVGPKVVETVGAPPPSSADAREATAAKPWWTDDEFSALNETIGGLRFAGVKVEFERKTKSIEIKSLRVSIVPDQGAIVVGARVRIPPELAEGETVPELDLNTEVKKSAATVGVLTQLSEGMLVGSAHVRPAPGNELEVESEIFLKSLPLSTLVPLLTKVAVIKREMKPKFLWLNCNVKVAGRFQGLFEKNPLSLKDCEIVGNGALIQIASATRLPGGAWKPFTASVKSVDLKQILETFSIEGLGGIATEFGRLDGTVDVSGHAATLRAQLEGLQLKFSNHNVRVLQPVHDVELSVGLKADGGVNGKISRLRVEGGEFEGQLSFDFAKSARRGEVQLDLKKLRLSPEVQTLMTGGLSAGLNGNLRAEFESGRLRKLGGRIDLVNLKAKSGALDILRISPVLREDGEVLLNLKSPEIRFSEESAYTAISKSILFKSNGDVMPVIRDVQVTGSFPWRGGFAWSKLSGSLEEGRVRFTSEGEWSRDRMLNAILRVDYPSVKKLEWVIAGPLEAPQVTFRDESAPIKILDLMRTDSVRRSVLGLSGQ